MSKSKSTQLKLAPQAETLEAPGKQPKTANREPIFDVVPQLPLEQNEMMELAARLVSDDHSAKALIAIMQRIADAEGFADRDRLINHVIRGAYLMSADIGLAIDRFSEVA